MNDQQRRALLIAQSLEASTKIHGVLRGIDLRKTSGDARTALQAAREHTAGQCAHLYEALHAEAPTSARATLAEPAPRDPT